LIIIAPNEIAARIAIAIKIGTTGEDPPPSPCEVEEEGFAVAWSADCTPFAEAPGEGLSGLPCWPEPLPVPVGPADPPSDPEDALPAEEPPSEGSESVEPVLVAGADAPPFDDFEDFAGGGSWWTGSLPVAVGGESEYWIPLESA
jgi:hypothetical protein